MGPLQDPLLNRAESEGRANTEEVFHTD